MQGQLWSETVRTADQMSAMIFPRMLALAERAWHKASWEDITDKKERDAKRTDDWVKFANSLGYKELGRLDKMGVAYHVAPPGARWDNPSSDSFSLHFGQQIQENDRRNNILIISCRRCLLI